MPYSNARFPGYQNLLEILSDKINVLIDENRIEPWTSLVDQVKSTFDDYELIDLSFLQQASLTLTVELNSSQNNFLKRSTKLIISISLLGTYYTIFFEENIGPYGPFKTNYALPINKIYYKSPSTEIESDIFQKATKLVQEYYSHYTFLNHIFLLSFPITGATPHGEDMETAKAKYLIFDFLFGYNIHSSKDVVLLNYP